MITWFSKTDIKAIATISTTNITVNKVGSKYLEQAYFVQLGLDKQNKQIIIHPLTKQEADLNLIEQDSLFKLSIHSSYARISSTAFINFISETFSIKYNKNGTKYICNYDLNNINLVIDLSKEVK